MDTDDLKGKGKEALNTGKEKAMAGAGVVNEKIKGLAFRGMLEKKVSSETRAKYPVLDKLIPLTNYVACGLIVLILVIVIANIGGGSNPVKLAQQTHELNQQALTALTNPRRATQLAREAIALERKVAKLSNRNKAIYDEELRRLTGLGLGGLLDSASSLFGGTQDIQGMMNTAGQALDAASSLLGGTQGMLDAAGQALDAASGLMGSTQDLQNLMGAAQQAAGMLDSLDVDNLMGTAQQAADMLNTMDVQGMMDSAQQAMDMLDALGY